MLSKEILSLRHLPWSDWRRLKLPRPCFPRKPWQWRLPEQRPLEQHPLEQRRPDAVVSAEHPPGPPGPDWLRLSWLHSAVPPAVSSPAKLDSVRREPMQPAWLAGRRRRQRLVRLARVRQARIRQARGAERRQRREWPHPVLLVLLSAFPISTIRASLGRASLGRASLGRVQPAQLRGWRMRDLPAWNRRCRWPIVVPGLPPLLWKRPLPLIHSI